MLFKIQRPSCCTDSWDEPYNPWLDVHGEEGLLRTNAKLRGSKGQREEKEEELQPAAFDADLQRLAIAAEALEKFRLQIIDWLYPE